MMGLDLEALGEAPGDVHGQQWRSVQSCAGWDRRRGGMLSLAGSLTAAGAREFRAADIQEENYPTVQALRFMDQLVAERTGGRHRIRVFHSRQLGEESQTIEQTRVGAIDLDRINVAAIGDVAPALNVLALPFLFRSIDHLYKVIDGPIGDDILAALEPNGFIGLTFYDSGARSIYTATPAGARPGRPQGHAHPRAAIRPDGADDEGARRHAGRAALRAGADRLVGPAGRRRGEQLALLRHHRPLPGGALLHGDGAHDGPGGPDHVAARLAGIVGRGPGDLSRRGARIRADTCASSGRAGRSSRKRQAAEAGVTIIDKIDRKPFEDATRPLRDELRADPKFGPLIERIEAVQ